MTTNNEIIKLITQIEEGNTDKSILLNESVIQIFNEYLSDASGIAYELERFLKPSLEDQYLLESTGNVVLRLFNIDGLILDQILEKSNYNDEQRKSLLAECKRTLDFLGGEVGFVFKAHSEDKRLIEMQEIRSFVNSRNSAKIMAETPERAFITYLVHEGFPSVVLERLARMSLYQEIHFSNDLKNNPSFNKIYQDFTKNGKLTKTQIISATATIENSLLFKLKHNPFVISKHENGYQHLDNRLLKDKTDKQLLYDRSPGGYFDAYTVKDDHLYVVTVTNNTDFESNRMPSIDCSRIISNTLKEKSTSLQDYSVTSYCNSPVYNSHEIDRISNKLMANGTISGAQANALIELPLNQEIFKILANTHHQEYDEYYNNIRIGVYGDDVPAAQLLASSLQFDVSLDKVLKAAQCLESIVLENPSLNNMTGETEKLILSLSYANKYAKEAAFLSGIKNDLTESSFNSIDRALIYLTERLISVNSDIASKINLSDVHKIALESRRNQLKTVYHDLQNSLKSNVPTTNQSLINDKKYKSVVLNKRMVENILKGDYSSANSSLLKDALIFRVSNMEDMIDSQTFKKTSMVQLIKGFEQAFKKRLDLHDVYKEILDKCPKLTQKILDDNHGVGVLNTIKNALVKIKNDNAYIPTDIAP